MNRSLSRKLRRKNFTPRVTAQISTDIYGYEPARNTLDGVVEPKRFLKTKTCCPARGCGCEQPINNFYVIPYAEDESDARRHLCKICWDIQNKPKNGLVRWRDMELIENGHETYNVLFFDEEWERKRKEKQAKELAEAHRRLDAYKKEYNRLKLKIAA